MPDNNGTTSNPPSDVKWYWASLLGIYLFSVCILLSYMLYQLWPPQKKAPDGSAQVAQKTNSNNTNQPPAQTTNTPASTGSATAPAGANPAAANTAAQPQTTQTPEAGASSGGAPNAGKTTEGTDGAKPAAAATEEMKPVQLLGWPIKIIVSPSPEVRLLLIVMLAGALGSFIHAATSFTSYVGNRKLAASWTWWYLLRPFIGMSLALVFYFVVRGGFISPQAGGEDLNPFGIAALAGLVGMFSKQAIDKLNEVFTTMFGSKGDEERADKLIAPKITSITPTTGPAAGGTPITISGAGFLSEAKVTFGGVAATTVVVSDDGKSITAVTPPHDAGKVDVEVVNSDGQKSTLAGGFTFE